MTQYTPLEVTEQPSRRSFQHDREDPTHDFIAGGSCKSIWAGPECDPQDPIIHVDMVGPLKYVFDCRGVLTVYNFDISSNFASISFIRAST